MAFKMKIQISFKLHNNSNNLRFGPVSIFYYVYIFFLPLKFVTSYKVVHVVDILNLKIEINVPTMKILFI